MSCDRFATEIAENDPKSATRTFASSGRDPALRAESRPIKASVVVFSGGRSRWFESSRARSLLPLARAEPPLPGQPRGGYVLRAACALDQRGIFLGWDFGVDQAGRRRRGSLNPLVRLDPGGHV